jgi:hypothetical protein
MSECPQSFIASAISPDLGRNCESHADGRTRIAFASTAGIGQFVCEFSHVALATRRVVWTPGD